MDTSDELNKSQNHFLLKIESLKKNIGLYLLIIIDIICSAIANTLWYRLTIKSNNFSYLYGQFYVTLLFAVFMIPVYFVHLFYQKCTKQSTVGILPKPNRWEFIKTYFMFSILETVIGYLAVLPSLYFSPVFLILFGQSSVILNHIGSYYYFKRSYSKIQIFSVLVILFAVVLATITESGKYSAVTDPNRVTQNNSSLIVEDDIDTGNISDPLYKQVTSVKDVGYYAYVILFIMAVFVRLISAFTNLYKEKKYKELSLNSIETLTIVSILETPMSLLIFVFLFLPLPPPAIHVPVDQLGNYITDGTYLLFFSEDKELFWIMIIFIFLSIVSSNIDFIITQKLNSSVNVISGVATLSLSIIFVGIEILAGVAYRKVMFYEYMALILIIMGIINYRIGTKDEEKKMLDVNGKEIYPSVSENRTGTPRVCLNSMIIQNESQQFEENTGFLADLLYYDPPNQIRTSNGDTISGDLNDFSLEKLKNTNDKMGDILITQDETL
jgi:hypothetical protein